MILVVDDDKTIRLSLKFILERNEYEVALAEGPKKAMQIVRNIPAVELVLMGLYMFRFLIIISHHQFFTAFGVQFLKKRSTFS